MRSWILDCFDWFDDRFEPPGALVVPTRTFFTAPRGSDPATARTVLEDVMRHLKHDRPVEIVPMDVLPAEYRVDYQALSSAAGTHETQGNTSIIRYDPALMNRPLQFINMLAHELMHARLAGLEDEVPGGAQAHELATDLGCIIAGFGVFQLQAADDAGWFGYMTQPSRAFALAVFLDRRGLTAEAAAPWLSARCRKLLAKAIREV